jgi:hypothetical protein
MSQPPPLPAPPTGPSFVGKTNGLAVGALVASLLGLFCGVGLVVGLVLGYIARRQIDDSGGVQRGRGLAVAAIVVGWVGIALAVIVGVIVAATGS